MSDNEAKPQDQTPHRVRAVVDQSPQREKVPPQEGPTASGRQIVIPTARPPYNNGWLYNDEAVKI